jgi:acetyl-CoA carboxylase carboxyltransferase component/biotin carboxyl carrier protein
MARAIGLSNIATFEFLVDADEPSRFYFLEANPRLQVEHTITEELTDVDLVRTQILLADGDSLAELGIVSRFPTGRFALQARINLESLQPDGSVVPTTGTIESLSLPGGPGVRVDTFAHVGYRTSVAYDSLLAKLIVRSNSGSIDELRRKSRAALDEFAIGGVGTNLELLKLLVSHPDFGTEAVTTRFVEDHLAELVPAGPTRVPAPADRDHAAVAPISGVVVRVEKGRDEPFRSGETLVVIESMKMEHEVAAARSGSVLDVLVAVGDSVSAGMPLIEVDYQAEDDDEHTGEADAVDLDVIRPDLRAVLDRRQAVPASARPAAVERRRARGRHTVDYYAAELCDDETFVEYGALVIAGQRRRRTVDDLISRTQRDGVLVGFGEINGAYFDPSVSQSLVIAFDDTVLAGTMGELAREKLKHCFEVARASCRPTVLFAEGGGGRAGDTDGKVGVTGWTMDVASYHQLSRLSGLVPLVGVNTGLCFAANAGMLMCCDVVIATKDSNIGVAGPSMIEAGRLGRFAPEEIGPVSVHAPNGVIDLVVEDDLAAIHAAKKYLSYFQGDLPEWTSPDQRRLRALVPENRVRAYDVRPVIETLADTDSVLELRRDFGASILTSLIRVEGKPLGVIANNPMYLGGAIDSDSADKACRFMGLCEAFDLPILMLCDTPGMMVGLDAERQAAVRRMGRMFVVGSNLTVPLFTIVLRKAYGIGAELMAGGWFKAPRFVVSWPTGEFGGMNLEGNVQLTHMAELAAMTDPAAKHEFFEARLAELYASGKALSAATHFEMDDVIDPADSRRWIHMGLAAHRPDRARTVKRVPYVDPC